MSAVRDVALRRWTLDDAEWYAEQAREAMIQRWTTERADVTADKVRAAIADIMHDDARWVIVDRRTRQRLGNAAIDFLNGVACPSYWVAAEARGRGVATAALRLMLHQAVARDAHQVELEIHRDNTASRRVAEKLGFLVAGTTKHPVLGPCVRYSLLMSTFVSKAVDETVA